MKNFLSIASESESEFIIERSRFIGYAARVDDETQAKAFVERIKKKNSLATHNCYAYITSTDGNVMRFSDDGEPQGTAGQPILEVLRNKKLFSTAVVVTRYFGGVKLGAGGLVRAYSRSATEALDAAQIVLNVYCRELEFQLTYEQYSRFLSFAETEKIKILSSTFNEIVLLKVVIPDESINNFDEIIKDRFQNKLNYTVSDSRYFPFEL